MKELSIEEKAKAYDDALERAKMSYHTGDYDKDALEMLEIIFPELKESEDEKMVKFIKQQLFKIKETITENYELDAKLTKAIDWLEKQGEKGINGNEREIPNSSWSKEDERIYQSIIDDTVQGNQLDSKQINWLRCLKDRYTWKPSDEQMSIIAQSVAVLKVFGYGELGDRLGDISEQLHKLRDE